MNTFLRPAQISFDKVYPTAPFSELIRLGLLLAEGVVKMRAQLRIDERPFSGADQVAGR